MTCQTLRFVAMARTRGCGGFSIGALQMATRVVAGAGMGQSLMERGRACAVAAMLCSVHRMKMAEVSRCAFNMGATFGYRRLYGTSFHARRGAYGPMKGGTSDTPRRSRTTFPRTSWEGGKFPILAADLLQVQAAPFACMRFTAGEFTRGSPVVPSSHPASFFDTLPASPGEYFLQPPKPLRFS